ncbi:hypothetical protein HK099_003774 [Clydaea vesicula]|uniref:Uncharacterized protein n=1 Tax=Clydaea vesicula TaxID=447962 RepID=A0AAD5XW40_9FUNG|nr:hypothetical protein HK099_003774 [Clydaea vesicula]
MASCHSLPFTVFIDMAIGPILRMASSRMSSLLQDLNDFNFENDAEPENNIPEIPKRGESSRRTFDRKSSNQTPFSERKASNTTPPISERKSSTTANSINGRTSVRTVNSNATTLNRSNNENNNIPVSYLDSVKILVETIQQKAGDKREKIDSNDKRSRKFSSISNSTSASDNFDSSI